MDLKNEFIDMLASLSKLPGGDAVASLANDLAATDPAVAIRLNPRKNASAPEALRPVPWASRGFYIDGDRPRFTMDPLMHQGAYYVQDPSSMAIGSIAASLAENSPIVYIDLCAAPGGKTTAAIDALPVGSLVIANEFDRRRCEALVENVVKWGYPNCVVSRGDTSRFRRLGPIADIVAVDAPCSGEGMMRKEEEAARQWSQGLVDQCAALQQEILLNAWHVLKPGGYLIYSTCTFNRSENEENLQYLIDRLGAEPVDPQLPLDNGIAPAIGSTLPARRFIPGCVEGEGLFAAVVRKPADSQVPASPSKPSKTAPSPLAKEVCGWLLDPDNYLITERADRLVALPRPWLPLIDRLEKELDVVHAGIPLADIKKSQRPGKNAASIIPAQALALSSALNPEAFPQAPTDYSSAIAYLRGESITLPADTPRGIILLTYAGRPLGFVKNLGNRANNLYPDPWKIRSTHLPPSPPSILT